MPNFTVQQVVSQAPWTHDQHGPFIGYELLLAELQGQTATLNQKPDTAPPTVGQVIEANLQDGPKGKLLKKVYAASQGSSNGARDDATGRSIERQVAAKAAAEMAAAAGGTAPQVVANFEGLFDAVIQKIQGQAAAPPAPSPTPPVAPPPSQGDPIPF